MLIMNKSYYSKLQAEYNSVGVDALPTPVKGVLYLKRSMITRRTMSLD